MHNKSIRQIQLELAGRKYTGRQLVEYYLDRIERLDVNGPALNAIIQLNPEVLDIADQLDHERSNSGTRGWLHGIPILLKDNIDTADKLSTSAGSLALADHKAKNDAFIVKKLREAGAIILGKANMSEWANFRSTNSSSGWSSRGGQTKNPHVLDRNPCGSSSGSAVAVAANLCAAAIGTETDGSIICPAHTNGIVGLKPTIGSVSRSGIIPISHTQDTAGPMGRTVSDIAVLLESMIGYDRNDPMIDRLRRDFPYPRKWPFTSLLEKPEKIAGARIGVARNYLGKHPLVDAIMEQAVELLHQAYTSITDPIYIETADQLYKHEQIILEYEFKDGLNKYLATHDAPIKSLTELIAYNETHADKIMPHFGQELLLKAEARGDLNEKPYKEAVAKARELSQTKGIDAVMKKHSIDFILAPSGGPAWLTDLMYGDNYPGLGSSSLAAVSGYPSITVPAGQVYGMPMGISFIGKRFSERELIRLALGFEQAAQIQRAPQFLPTITI